MTTIALMPIPIEQTPKIKVISVLNLADSLSPNKPPIIPPNKTDNELIMTPVGIVKTPLILKITYSTIPIKKRGRKFL